MKKSGNFFNILKAMRVYRILPSLTVILVSAGFANKINKEIFLLGIISVLIYSAASIHNAFRDKDFSFTKNYWVVSFGILLLALSLSFTNIIIFMTAITSIFLGFFYNTISRFLLLGDTTILAITHFALPSFAASLLLSLDTNFAFSLAGFMFMGFWFILPIKNLKDYKSDKKRGYKTLVTVLKNGKAITIFLFAVSFLFMTLGFFLFELSPVFLGIIFINMCLGVFIIRNVSLNKDGRALDLTRMVILLFLIGLIISSSFNFKIIFLALSFAFTYLFLLIKFFK